MERLREYLLNYFSEESLSYCNTWDKSSIDFKRLVKKIEDYNYIYGTYCSIYDIEI